MSPFASARAFEDDGFVRIARSKANPFPFANPKTSEASNMPNTSSDAIENMTKPDLRRAGVRGGEFRAMVTATSTATGYDGRASDSVIEKDEEMPSQPAGRDYMTSAHLPACLYSVIVYS